MEKIKPYTKYRPSKTVWFDSIPNEWIVCKVKHIAKTYAGGTPSTGNPNYWENGNIPWLPSGKLQNAIITTANKFITEEGLNNSSTKWIKPNTVLIALTGATCSNIGYLTFEACANQSVVAIVESKVKSNSRYLYFMFLAIRSQILTYKNGGAQAGINDRDVKELIILNPSLPEQTAIANFLDFKTAKIDRFIRKKKQLIKLLNEQKAGIINNAVTKGLNPKAKMKPSGIEWLGDIPEHWELGKLKSYASAYGRIGFRGYKTTDLVSSGEGAITISPSNMKLDFMTFEKCSYLSWEKYEESPEIKIYNDDLIMVKTGSTYGKVGIVKTLSEKATINPQLLVFKNVRINPNYLYLLLKSNLVQTQVKMEVIGSTIPTISQAKILNFKIILPPVNEIETLLTSIAKETEKLNAAITTIEKEIALTQEYRTTLIAEAVTGKIDVRNYKVPEIVEEEELTDDTDDEVLEETTNDDEL